MPRFEEYAPIFDAYQKFVNTCIIQSKSLLWQRDNIWTLDNLEKLRPAFLEHYDLGDSSFLEKLDNQLRELSKDVWMIIGDTWYFYYLVARSNQPRGTNFNTKKTQLFQITERVGQAIPIPETDIIWEAQRIGLVRPGTYFNTRRDSFFRFILLWIIELKRLENPAEILANAAALEKLLGNIHLPDNESAAGKQMTQAILYMAFPESYEPIISSDAIQKIVSSFDNYLTGEEKNIHEQLRTIRSGIAKNYKINENFNFYDLPIKKIWEGGENNAMEQPNEASEITEALLEQMLEYLKYTKNIILYGVPGTGKTYLADRVAERLVRNNLKEPPSKEEIETSLVETLKFYELLALAMYIANEDNPLQPVNVNAIEKYPLITKYHERKSIKQPTQALWGHLQLHADPENTAIKAKRSKPYLFDKNTSSQWYLTQRGKQYVEQELGDQLELLTTKPIRKSIGDLIRRVTFHQSFSYEDFVEGLRPILSKDKENPEDLAYTIEQGIFRRICSEALLDRDNPYVLIIDEINRGNVAKIFGELITLIEDDKRSSGENRFDVRLPYSGESFSVPSNLYIIGTMNTADRSIALLDIALRRRFAFVSIPPNPDFLASAVVRMDDIEVNLKNLLNNLNQKLKGMLGQDYQIGHSYFLKVTKILSEGQDGHGILSFVWNNQIIPLLEEYFYSDRSELRTLLPSAFFSDVSIGSEEVKIEILTGRNLLSALQILAST